MQKKKLNVILILFMVLAFPLISHSKVSILVSYPHSACLDQKISIGFNVLQQINSTNFTIISSGVKINHNVYEGSPSGGSYVIFPINVSLENVSQIIITFVGTYNMSDLTIPGIVLYSGDFKPPTPDVDQGYFDSIIITFDGRIYYHYYNPKDHSVSLNNPVSNLPYYGKLVNNWINTTIPVNYTFILKNDNGSTLIKEMFLNGSKYSINYLTPIHWNFSYVGIRLDSNHDFIIPEKFVVSFPYVEKYIAYVNDKEYLSGYTNAFGEGTFSLKITSSSTVNITFPYLHEYKVISISTSGKPDIRVNYPVTTISLLIVSILLSIISFIVYEKFPKKL